jgi:hypothetical protein
MLARRSAEALRETAMAARLARDVPAFLRSRVTFAEARARVQRRLDHREARLLRNVERAIYGNPGSPYLALLRQAGCEVGDVRALVANDGIEGALAVLRDQGVYLTFDEFKGLRDAARGSTRFRFRQEDFDNPDFTPHFVEYTGGTRGEPGAVMRSLPYMRESIDTFATVLDAHGLVGARHIFWITQQIITMVSYSILGQEIAGWLYPLHPLPPKLWAAARLLAAAGRLTGHRFPRPRHLDVQDARRLAAWVDRRPRDGRPLVVSGLTSLLVRVAVAAREAGMDLRSVTFRGQSEPMTAARHEHLRACGARVIDNYSLIEATNLAFSCADSDAYDDLHVRSDQYAMIERERAVLEGGPSVSALLITTLSPLAPKICLNTETGDYASMVQRQCGCLMGDLGMTTHLSRIRSFEKLSTEGVTFVRTNLIDIVEATLPARFGGSSLDYQLLEEEAADGTARLALRVNPSVGAVDEAALRATFLAELGRGGMVDRYHAELLRRAASVEVQRRPPLATRAGKILPFHLVR